jgi:hypothetical protein
MNSFIPRESKVKEDTISVRLDCQVIEELKLYSLYLESSQNYVICQVLRKAFRKDKDFTAWRATQIAGNGAAPRTRRPQLTRPSAETATA